MSSWQAILLGLLQGLTEFLPVSSSGHLALGQIAMERLGFAFSQPGVVFDAMLHVGTAGAVLVYERRSIVGWLRSHAGLRLLGLLVVGTLATAIFAFPMRGVAEAAFSQSLWVGFFLVITGAVVLATRWLPGGDRGEAEMTWRQAVLVGLAQGLAVLPGISRSGLTIVSGLGSGLERAWAARFSFLLSVPAIAGATLVELIGERDAVGAMGIGFWLACAVGALAAGVSGYVALGLVIRTMGSRVFHRFGWYCVPLGLVVMVVSVGWPG